MKRIFENIQAWAWVLTVALTLPFPACGTLEPGLQNMREMFSAPPKPAGAQPEKPDLEFAREQFKKGDYPVAEFYLKKTLLKYPEEAEALKLLPWTYFYQKRFDKARLAFERANTFYPGDPEPWIGLGWAHFALQQYLPALEAFTQAEKLSPQSYEAHKGKGMCHLLLRRPNRARGEFEKIFLLPEVDRLMEFWSSRYSEFPNQPLDVVPSELDTPSVFTLPVEHPRYRSTLLGLSIPGDGAIELGWTHYRKQSFRKALTTFETSAAAPGASPDGKNGLGWTLLQKRKIKEAETLFREILDSYPEMVGARMGLQEVRNIKLRRAGYAQYYLDLDKYRLAEKSIRNILKEFPDWAHPYNQLGLLELKRKNFQAARQHFEHSLALEPDNTGARQGLKQLQKVEGAKLFEGNQARKSKNYKTAAHHFSDYIDERGPSLPITASVAEAYSGLGWSQYEKGKYDYAIDKFETAVQHPDFKIDATRGLGYSYYQQGEFDKAARFLQIAYDANPADLETAYKLDKSILQTRESQQAETYFQQTLVHHPKRASLYMGLGWIHAKRKNPDLAVEYFLKAISLDPDFALSEEFKEWMAGQRFGWQVYNGLGWTYYHKAEYEESIKMFKTSLERKPKQSEAHKGMGYALFQMGNYELAAQYLRRCLAHNAEPGSIMETAMFEKDISQVKMETTARTKLGRIYYLLGKFSRGIRMFTQELLRNPDQADAYDGLGWIYLEQDRLQESRAAFARAAQLNPLNPFTHNMLAKVKRLLASRKMVKGVPAPGSGRQFEEANRKPNELSAVIP